MLQKYNRPIFFFGISLVIPWILWFFVVYLSHLSEKTPFILWVETILWLVGLVAPFFVAMYLFFKDSELLKDFKKRFSFNGVHFSSIFIILALTFGSIILAQAISVLLGYSADQFVVSGNPSFSSGMLVSAWFLIMFAPVVEELAWHSYGTDALRQKFSLFAASMIFAIYWALWHLPLGFVKGYYQNQVVVEWPVYGLNFILSVPVFMIIMNWLYYKNNRNILIPVAFHLCANVANEMFATHPDSKVIQTGIFAILAGYILWSERKMFFTKTLEEK